MLYIFSGLPGTGKTELAKYLARKLGAAYLRIDTVEQALRRIGVLPVDGKGYALSRGLAADNLRIGLPVIVDSVNPWELTRRQWREVATEMGQNYLDIEVVCSSKAEHRKRVEERISDIPGLKLPTWEQVQNRDYHPWTNPRLLVDTAGSTTEESQRELVRLIAEITSVG